MNVRKCLSENVKERRKAAGFKSSRAFAEKVGASPVTMARIEAGMTLPEEATIRQIAIGLGCEETDLFRDPSATSPIEAVTVIASALGIKITAKEDSISPVKRKIVQLLSALDDEKHAPAINRILNNLQALADLNASLTGSRSPVSKKSG